MTTKIILNNKYGEKKREEKILTCDYINFTPVGIHYNHGVNNWYFFYNNYSSIQFDITP